MGSLSKKGASIQESVSIQSMEIRAQGGWSVEKKGVFEITTTFVSEKQKQETRQDEIQVYVQIGEKEGVSETYEVKSCSDSLGVEFVGNLPETCKLNQLIVFNSSNNKEFECSDTYKPSTFFQRVNMEMNAPGVTDVVYNHWSVEVKKVKGVSESAHSSYSSKQGSLYMKGDVKSSKNFNIVSVISDQNIDGNDASREIYKPKIQGSKGKLFVSAYVPIREHKGSWNGAHVASIYYRSCGTPTSCSSADWKLLSFASVFNINDWGKHSAGGASTVQGQLEIDPDKYYEFILDINSTETSTHRAGSIFEQDHRFFGIWEFVETFL